MNLLSPVIQTKRTVNGQTVDVSATRWKNWPCSGCTSGSAPAPFDAYVWKRGGTEDFTAWNEVDPVSTTDWKFLNSVQVNDEGQVFETTDISGNSRSTIFHPALPRVLADISNASADEVLYEGFEDCVTNCSTEAKTGSKGSQAA